MIFDVGHGQGSFDWRVAEEAASARGFWPDLISTDLHSGNVDGAAKDLTHVMSKFLALGMPFYEVLPSNETFFGSMKDSGRCFFSNYLASPNLPKIEHSLSTAHRLSLCPRIWYSTVYSYINSTCRPGF